MEELIRSIRTHRGLSQAHLARRVGTHQSAQARGGRGLTGVETLDLLRAMGERLEIAGVEPDRDHGVDYVLIGGLAVQTHGHVRTANDAGLIPAPNPGHLKKLAAARATRRHRCAGGEPGRPDPDEASPRPSDRPL
ncbi:MAG TPA: helix-turn-helix domain-containing protein [Solirubrobacterales bacterium]|nr:helix-turn-helix domain-containing protein [Solirubrobacterales bacterium]